MDVESAKKLGPERHLTKKYNFLGPGTFYAARMKGSDFYEKLMKDSGHKLVGTKPYNQPVNALDACAKKHDKTYNDPKATASEVQASDKAMIVCSKKIAHTLGLSDKLVAKVTTTGFEGKNALERLGVMRKGSFAEGGAKESGLGKKIKAIASLGSKRKKVTKKGLKYNV